MDRLELIQKTLDRAYQETDTFEEEPWVTSRLLYLIGAIARGTHIELDPADQTDDAFVSWLQMHMDWDALSPYIRPLQ